MRTLQRHRAPRTASSLRRAALASRRGGFTIVEVVLAMFLLLIGMTSILGLLSFGAALSRTAALRGDSALAIEAIVADLEETLFPLVEGPDGRLVAGPPVDVENRAVRGRPGLRYSARATPEPSPDGADEDLVLGAPRLYKVDVEIRWSAEGATRSRRYSTLLVREVPFGERLRSELVSHGSVKR